MIRREISYSSCFSWLIPLAIFAGKAAWTESVSRILYPPVGGRRSFIWADDCSSAQATYPETRADNWDEPSTPAAQTGHSMRVSLFGLAPRGVCLARSIPGPAGGLLH